MEFMRGLDWSPLLISLKTGVVATILSFFGGIFAARQVIKAGPKTKAVLDGILTLPMVLPPTVAGFFLLLIFSLRRPFGAALYEGYGIKVVQTWLGCVLAATVIAFPLMYRNARAAFEQVDANLIYAARTLGMSEGRDSIGASRNTFWNDFDICKSHGRVWSYIYACRKYSEKDRNDFSENCDGNSKWRLQDSRFLGNGDHGDCIYRCAVNESFRIRKKQTEKTMVMIEAKDRYVAGNDKKETGKFFAGCGLLHGWRRICNSGCIWMRKKYDVKMYCRY